MRGDKKTPIRKATKGFPSQCGCGVKCGAREGDAQSWCTPSAGLFVVLSSFYTVLCRHNINRRRKKTQHSIRFPAHLLRKVSRSYIVRGLILAPSAATPPPPRTASFAVTCNSDSCSPVKRTVSNHDGPVPIGWDGARDPTVTGFCAICDVCWYLDLVRSERGVSKRR